MARCAPRTRVIAFIFLLSLACIPGVSAQQPQPSASALTPVPRFVWFNGVFRPADGGPAAPVETATIAVYQEREGGGALWQETQAIAVATDGRYNVLLGSTSSDGLPPALFTSGEPRWIGITFARAGEGEQPRVTLASVPYAIKAADADTLGGRPASAYRLADSATSSGSSAIQAEGSSANNPVLPITAGTPGYLGMFTDGTSLGNSTLYQSGGNLGQGTTTPLDAFHVRFTDAVGAITGYAVQNLSATGYSGMLFYDQAGALGQFQGFNNSTHEYRINNIAPSGTINFMIGSSSKLKVANSGNVGIGVASPTSRLDVAGDINTTGAFKISGSPVLHLPASGANNLGVGISAFGSNTNTGNANTAMGVAALQNNTTGSFNTAIGFAALLNNLVGTDNTAIGEFALLTNLSGAQNTAMGVAALGNNTTGSSNIAIGYQSAVNVTTGSNNITIGHPGTSGDSEVIRIGTPGIQNKFFAAGIQGVTTGSNDAVAVLIDSTGQLGTVSSSRRYKEDIHDMGEASRRVLQLRPVTFRYRNPFADGSKPIQYGLIAEEVAEVYPDLVAHSADGQIETVKYQLLDVLLLNEVQRQQANIRALEEQNRDLKQRLEKLEAALAR